MLHRIVYSSTAAVAFSEDDLAALLKQSQENNEASGLTGLLLHYPAGQLHQECFLQALEGERKALEETYSRIAEDVRHHSLSLVSSDAVPSRLFGRWTMALRPITDEDALRAVASRSSGTTGVPSVPELLLDPFAAEILLSTCAA